MTVSAPSSSSSLASSAEGLAPKSYENNRGVGERPLTDVDIRAWLDGDCLAVNLVDSIVDELPEFRVSWRCLDVAAAEGAYMG